MRPTDWHEPHAVPPTGHPQRHGSKRRERAIVRFKRSPWVCVGGDCPGGSWGKPKTEDMTKSVSGRLY